MFADFALALGLGALSALLVALVFIGRALGVLAGRWLSSRIVNPVPNSWGDHSAWNGPGA